MKVRIDKLDNPENENTLVLQGEISFTGGRSPVPRYNTRRDAAPNACFSSLKATFTGLPFLPLGETTMTNDKAVRIAEKLAKENGGTLPNPKWLEKNYSDLQQAMRKHPRAFAHLSQG